MRVYVNNKEKVIEDPIWNTFSELVDGVIKIYDNRIDENVKRNTKSIKKRENISADSSSAFWDSGNVKIAVKKQLLPAVDSGRLRGKRRQPYNGDSKHGGII